MIAEMNRSRFSKSSSSFDESFSSAISHPFQSVGRREPLSTPAVSISPNSSDRILCNDGHSLSLTSISSRGSFGIEPQSEWLYNLHRLFESHHWIDPKNSDSLYRSILGFFMEIAFVEVSGHETFGSFSQLIRGVNNLPVFGVTSLMSTFRCSLA